MYSLNQTFLRRSLVVLLVIAGLHDVGAEGIRSPWRASPTIVLNGGKFEILLDTPVDSPIDSIRLESPYHQAKLLIERVELGSHVFDPYTKESVNTKAVVRVEGSVPEDLYDLLVFTSSKSHRSIRSVKVIRSYKKQHRFIHISDPHISRQWVGAPDGGYAKELELFDKFVDIANIIAPDFIICTGDLIHDYTRMNADSLGWGGTLHTEATARPLADEKFRNYFEGANGLKGVSGLVSPTFSIPGNHDFYGIPADDYMEKSRQWNVLCGKRTFGMAYGDTRVLFMDDYLGDPVKDVPRHAPLSGLQGDVLKQFLAAEGMGKIRILAQHRPDRIDTTFCDSLEIKLILNGHNHRPFQQLVGKTPTLSIRPGSVSRSGSVENWKDVLGYFRIFTLEGENYTFTEPLRFVDNPVDEYNHLQSNLSVDFHRSNDGLYDRNVATITNRFPITLTSCALRFVMKKGDYLVEGAEINQLFDSGTRTIVDVRFTVNGNERQTIAIKQR